MPSVGERITTFKQFAESSLEGIYGARLGEALKVTANHSESGVWINRSTGGQIAFEWKPFPRFAQIAPVYGVTACDFDADGVLDLHLVQNFYSNQMETGMWRGGVSQFLRGKGDGDLECVPPLDTGLVISDDGKASTVCDLNNDQLPDVVASQNNGSLRSFVRNVAAEGGAKFVALRLVGEFGNPEAVGARVISTYDDGRALHQTITAGGGYLSQQSALVFVALGGLEQVSVTWPDGSETRIEPKPADAPIVLMAPPGRRHTEPNESSGEAIQINR